MVIPLIHRKESLILTTIEVIDELGIQGLTTKEIAKRQGVSEATLFRHYKNKSELLLSVLEYFSQYDNDIFQSINLKKLNPIEAIKYFVKLYAVYYENYPAITSITQVYDVLQCDIELSEKVKSIFSNRCEFVKNMIEQAQREGYIKNNADCDTLADIIISTCNGICLKWRLNNFNFSLRCKTILAIDMILDSFSIIKI